MIIPLSLFPPAGGGGGRKKDGEERMLELNRLYCMDCMQGMKEFPDGFFDLAIVDPPYGIGIDGQKILDRVKELADKYNQQYK